MDLDTLKEIKERANKRTSMRKTEAETKVVVCMGTCGIAAGARSVLSAFVNAVNEADLDDVLVTQAGCKGLCSHEPVAEVITPEEKITYGDLSPEKAREIVQNHLINGNVITDYVVSSE